MNVSRGAAGNKCPHATAARVHARRPLLARRPNATVAARASSSDADGEDDGSASKENGFYGDPNFDGNMGREGQALLSSHSSPPWLDHYGTLPTLRETQSRVNGEIRR